MYGTNEDFTAYVDKYMAKEGITLEAALQHKVVRNYAEYLKERGGAEAALPNMWTSAGAAHENVIEG
jgi:hypothetical protein